MRKGPKLLLWSVVIGMALVTFFQWIAAFGGAEEPKADARRMLYEASLFQVELLAGHAAEAASAGTTGELDGLKQAAYSVEYTHARFADALGSGVPELRSAGVLMELLVRLQIGGERKLKAEEAEVLAAAAPYLSELHDAYAELFDADGALDAAAAERIRLADEEIAALLEREGR
ncbi:S-adenosylmethionine decarboxylase [Paenibacillus sp.]|uniref:S-adenosylmethionine decarboxylase n=1 Tax=Paenibacillus sp. TaxID=58172 RepID=UPI0028113E14|nr:S-adenosylmethionine decarboxylase [Paenibacillus sp.]